MRTWILVTCAALWSVAFIAVLQIPGLSASMVTLVSDAGQLLAACAASAGCAVAARASEGHRRSAWAWLSAGTGSWAAGQAVWSFYEVVLGREVPFPSAADVGFLAFPLVAGFGLVLWLGTQGDQLVARGRDLMDGVIIAASLLVLSWVTVMAPVVADGGVSGFPLVLSLAYPVGDVVLATLVLLALARGTVADRTILLLLAVGLGGFALSDSLFVYLTSTGTYSSADLVSNSGWVVGFLFVGVAGTAVAVRPTTDAVRRTSVSAGSPWPQMLLPYLPLLGAGAALCADLLDADGTARIDLLLGVPLVGMVLLRQFLAMADNQRLLSALAEARDQLEHQALHDSLTGLSNRVLFADRLDRALLAPSATVSVLFCDLDDFKLVNDNLGHEAGDHLLTLVAHRLLDCVRATDTVARLGGDEFAILLDESSDARVVADRVVASMQEEVEVLGHRVRTSISVGIAHHEGSAAPAEERRGPSTARDEVRTRRDLAALHQREATAALLLRLADTAMYAAKGAGKGRAILAPQPVGSEVPVA